MTLTIDLIFAIFGKSTLIFLHFLQVKNLKPIENEQRDVRAKMVTVLRQKNHSLLTFKYLFQTTLC